MSNIIEQKKKKLDHLINKYVNKSKKNPFLKHIKYFEDNDTKTINQHSITDQWARLSRESRIKTGVKAKITISQTNASATDMAKIKGCPYSYKNNFTTDEIMNYLKHPCDTDFVNSDGSIRVKNLTKFMYKYFELDEHGDTYFLRKSVMESYLRECAVRDKDIRRRLRCYLPSFENIAYAEWNEFYLSFTDKYIKGEQAVSVKIFLQFYLDPDALYSQKLLGNLPCKKPKKKNRINKLIYS